MLVEPDDVVSPDRTALSASFLSLRRLGILRVGTPPNAAASASRVGGTWSNNSSLNGNGANSSWSPGGGEAAAGGVMLSGLPSGGLRVSS